MRSPVPGRAGLSPRPAKSNRSEGIPAEAKRRASLTWALYGPTCGSAPMLMNSTAGAWAFGVRESVNTPKSAESEKRWGDSTHCSLSCRDPARGASWVRFRPAVRKLRVSAITRLMASPGRTEASQGFIKSVYPPTCVHLMLLPGTPPRARRTVSPPGKSSCRTTLTSLTSEERKSASESSDNACAVSGDISNPPASRAGASPVADPARSGVVTADIIRRVRTYSLPVPHGAHSTSDAIGAILGAAAAASVAPIRSPTRVTAPSPVASRMYRAAASISAIHVASCPPRSHRSPEFPVPV